MPDLIHRALKAIDHNRYAFVGLALAVLMLCTAWGCEMTASSPHSGEQLTRRELTQEAAKVQAERQILLAETEAQIIALQKRIEAEVGLTEALFAGYESALADIERKEAIVARTLGAMGTLAEQYAGPAVEPLLVALGLSGGAAAGGLLLDNRRKDQLIKQPKTGA